AGAVPRRSLPRHPCSHAACAGSSDGDLRRTGQRDAIRPPERGQEAAQGRQVRKGPDTQAWQMRTCQAQNQAQEQKESVHPQGRQTMIGAARRSMVVAVLLGSLGLGAGPASAATESPGWKIDSVAAPTDFSSAHSDAYEVYVANAGSQPTDEADEITV